MTAGRPNRRSGAWTPVRCLNRINLIFQVVFPLLSNTWTTFDSSTRFFCLPLLNRAKVQSNYRDTIGVWPSGRATVFGTGDRRFESYHPSQQPFFHEIQILSPEEILDSGTLLQNSHPALCKHKGRQTTRNDRQANCGGSGCVEIGPHTQQTQDASRFPVDGGLTSRRIDILARERTTGDWLIVELKRAEAKSAYLPYNRYK